MKRFFFLFCFFFFLKSALAQSSLEYYFKAVAGLSAGKSDSAIFFCDRSLEITSDTVVLLFKAHCLSGSGKYAEAFETAEKVVSAGNLFASLDAARYASLSKKNDDAFRHLDSYLKIPQRLPDNFIKTDTSFKNITSDPRWEATWKNQPSDEWMDMKADVYYSLSRKEYDQLFDVLDKALEKFSDKDELFYFRFLVYFNTQNYKGAQQNIKKAIKLDPANSNYYLSLARLFSKQKLYKEACARYQKYKSLNKYDILVFPEIIDNALEAGQYDIVISYAEYYLIFFRKDAGVLFKQGLALEKRKDYATALATYTSVLNLDSRYADAYFRRGMCYYEMSDWENAFNEFTLTLDLKPRTGEVFYYRGITRLNKGDKVGACHDFERAKTYNYLQAADYMLKFCKGQ